MGTKVTPKASIIGLTVALGLTLSACGPKGGNNDNGPKAPIGNIRIDSNISTPHRDYLAQSVAYLDSLTNFGAQPDLSQITGLNSISAESLHQWLEDRVQYILAPNFDPTQREQGFYSNQAFAYENPSIFPTIDQGTAVSDIGVGATKATLLMQNLGASYYYEGKIDGRLIGFNIPGSGPVLLTSPRVGVIQLGANLFPDGPLPPSLYNYILLISTIFHEAHHSDGNGTSLGFFHAVCPAGHEYAGYLACDRTLNGPYQLGAILERTLIGNCSQCTAKQSEMLSELVNDNLSRVLKTSQVNGQTVTSTNWDSTPEGHR
jgi:hypothetical protein